MQTKSLLVDTNYDFEIQQCEERFDSTSFGLFLILFHKLFITFFLMLKTSCMPIKGHQKLNCTFQSPQNVMWSDEVNE